PICLIIPGDHEVKSPQAMNTHHFLTHSPPSSPRNVKIMRLQNYFDIHQAWHSSNDFPSLAPCHELFVILFWYAVVAVEYAEHALPVYHDTLDGVQSVREDGSRKMSDVSRVVEVEDVLGIQDVNGLGVAEKHRQ